MQVPRALRRPASVNPRKVETFNFPSEQQTCAAPREPTWRPSRAAKGTEVRRSSTQLVVAAMDPRKAANATRIEFKRAGILAARRCGVDRPEGTAGLGIKDGATLPTAQIPGCRKMFRAHRGPCRASAYP